MPSVQKRLGQSVDIQTLEDMIQRHTERFERMFVIVDVINECEATGQVEKMLLGLAKSGRNLRLLIPSTNSPKQTWKDFPEYISGRELHGHEDRQRRYPQLCRPQDC
jgi:hypothetical protein